MGMKIVRKNVVLLTITSLLVPLLLFLSPIAVFAAVINGTHGGEIINGTPGSDTIKGFKGNDIIYGDGGNDIISAGTGNDKVYGGNGNDRIYGYKGNDVLSGDKGNDFIKDSYGDNKAYGGPGNDRIEFAHADEFGGCSGERAYGGSGNDYIRIALRNAECNLDVYGGIGNDIVICDIGNCYTRGGDGNDKIYLNDGEEVASTVALGGDGNDFLYGSAIHNLDGDEGNDILKDGALMDGGPGADHFICSLEGAQVFDYNPSEGDTFEGNCEDIDGNPL